MRSESQSREEQGRHLGVVAAAKVLVFEITHKLILGKGRRNLKKENTKNIE